MKKVSPASSSRKLFRHQCTIVNNLLHNAKHTQFSSRVIEGDYDQTKNLLNFVGSLQEESNNPPRSSDYDLADEFSEYFGNKIGTIRASLYHRAKGLQKPIHSASGPLLNISLTCFKLVSTAEVKHIIVQPSASTFIVLFFQSFCYFINIVLFLNFL